MRQNARPRRRSDEDSNRQQTVGHRDALFSNEEHKAPNASKSENLFPKRSGIPSILRIMALLALTWTTGCASAPWMRGVFSARLFEEDHFSEWEWLEGEPPEAVEVAEEPPRAEGSGADIESSDRRNRLASRNEELTLAHEEDPRLVDRLPQSTTVATAVTTSDGSRDHRSAPPAHVERSRRSWRTPAAEGQHLDDSAVYRPLPTSLNLHFNP